MSKYRVDTASLKFHTPPGTHVPQLLEAFCDWTATRRNGSLGYFELAGDRLDDYYVEDGSRRASAFVGFLRTADGSRVGWWRPGGEALDDAPIVVLGGEGQLAAVSRTLEGFLLKLATKTISVDKTALYDLVGDIGAADEGYSALLAWLRGHGIHEERRTESLVDETAALRAWFKQWSAERNELARANAARWLLATLLRDIIGLPPPEKPWAGGRAILAMTANQCALYSTPLGSASPALSSRFESCARRLREQDAAELPEAGLWFYSGVQLASDGTLLMKREYLREPDRRHIVLDDVGLKQDAIARPRSAYWMPDWLARRIG
jgi:hypothetical protein